MRKSDRTDWRVLAAFLLPSFIGFFVFVALPIVFALGLSLTNFSGGAKFSFVGLNNYLRLFRNADFLSSLGVTVSFTIFSVAAQLALGLGFALLLKKKFLGRSFFRGLFFLPTILSSIALGLAFITLFNPNEGLLNKLIELLGLPGSKWLAGGHTALLSIIIVTVWQNFGYYMIIFIGGLLSIDESLYEAASIDGAGAWTRFFRITLPGLSPVVFFAVTIAIINAFKVFDLVFVMTGGQQGGGPAGATNVLVFDIYLRGFTNSFFGAASAESVILLLIVLAITLFQQSFQRKWVSYDVV